MEFDNIDAKTAFHLGFAARCQEEGVTAKSAAQRIEFFEKAAILPALPALGSAVWPWLAALGTGAYALYQGTKGVAKEVAPAAKFLAGVPIAAGLAGGAGLGYGLAKLNEPSVTEDDIKAQELAQTYKIYADRLKARQAYQKYRQAQPV
jgi:hypothetical protein